jgi:hypothetical protein
MADMYKREPQNLTGPGGDQKELRVKYIDNGDGTWSLAVGALILPLPSGAATAAKQDTTNIKLDDLIVAVEGISGTAAYEMRNDTTTDPNLVYLGKALPGASTSDAAWQIKRYDKSAGLMSFADDVTTLTLVWDNRSTYGY